MARTNTLIRIDSSEVQGPDSFVVLRKPSWKMMRQIVKQQQSSENDDAAIGMLALETIMPDLIVDWNWAKEEADGEMILLPTPVTQPDILDELDFEEVMFLIEHVTPLLSQLKGARPN